MSDQPSEHESEASRSRLEQMQDARAARREQLEKDTDAQFLEDLEFIDALEIEHGTSNVSVIRVPFDAHGVPVSVVVRTPKPAEVSRYRDRLKAEKADTAKAAEEIGAVCRVYPDRDVFDKIADKRPGVKAQCGVAALALAVGTAESEGKG